MTQITTAEGPFKAAQEPFPAGMSGEAAEANFQGEDEPLTDGKGFKPRLVSTGYQNQADNKGRNKELYKIRKQAADRRKSYCGIIVSRQSHDASEKGLERNAHSLSHQG